MRAGPSWIEEPGSLGSEDFEYFRLRIRERAGINLSPAKLGLVQTRLRQRMGAHGLDSYGKYRELLEGLPAGDPEWQLFVNQLTTNKTEFFREPAHFHALEQDFLPAWKRAAAPGGRLNVWCAASSTGEEPYTIAMTLKSQSVPFEILATDIDTQVLATAANAVYSRAKAAEIPDRYRDCLNWGQRELADWVRIAPEVKSTVKFRTHNLLIPEPPAEGPFDLIFCRNVFIYFSPSTVEDALTTLYKAAKPGALLFIGHSESLQKTRNRWIYRRPSVYQKAPA